MKCSLFLFVAFFGLVTTAQVNEVDDQGRKQGKWEKLYEGTRVYMYRGQFENNQRVGAWEAFHANGNRSSTVRYNDGVKHGYTIAYDTSGKRIGEQMYHFGKRIQGKRLENLLKQLEEKGINPYTMEAK